MVRQILVVDDDPGVASSLGEGLADNGFAASCVATLAAAEDALSGPDCEFSAVVLDVRLPDGDGRDLCAKLRRNGSDLPIILLSGLDAEDDIVYGLNKGADAYVAKPFAMAEVVARLRHLLHQ